MFLGAMPRRPSKAAAYKQLRSHLSMMAVCVVAVRAAPYVLHFLSREKEELKLEL